MLTANKTTEDGRSRQFTVSAHIKIMLIGLVALFGAIHILGASKSPVFEMGALIFSSWLTWEIVKTAKLSRIGTILEGWMVSEVENFIEDKATLQCTYSMNAKIAPSISTGPGERNYRFSSVGSPFPEAAPQSSVASFEDIFLDSCNGLSLQISDLTHAIFREGYPNYIVRPINSFASLMTRRRLWPTRLAKIDIKQLSTQNSISFPALIAEVEGERYLVVLVGDSSGFLDSLQDAENRAILRHFIKEAVVIVEVPPILRSAILRRYLAISPGARRHVPIDYQSSLEDFEDISPRFPIFRIDNS